MIEGVTLCEERIPSAMHPENTALGIGTIIVAVRDALRLARFFETVPGRQSLPTELRGLKAAGFTVEIGPHTRCDALADQ